MNRLKLLFGMALSLGLMAFSAAPAFAEFESTSGSFSGPAKESNFVFSGGGSTLECGSAEGKWDLGALRSHKEIFTIESWKACKTKSKEFKELTPKVKGCQYEQQQAAGSFTPKMTQVSECTYSFTVLFINCTIHVPTESNKELSGGFGENSGENWILKENVPGMTDTTSGTCPGITGTKESVLKQLMTVVGQRLV